jgi:hypothetical protein
VLFCRLEFFKGYTMSSYDNPWQGCAANLLASRCRCRTVAAPAVDHTVACFDRIDDAPAAWESVTAGSGLFLGRAYLRLLETNGPAGHTPRYALVERGGRPVAAIATQIFDVDDELLAVRDRTAYNAGQRPLGRALDKTTMWLRNKGLGLLGRRVLICGNLFSCGLDGIAFAPGEDPVEIWPLVMEAVQRIQQADGRVAFLAVKDPLAQHSDHRRALRAAGFAHLKVEPSMDLHAPAAWRSRADYLDALNTKYRKAANKIDEAMAKAGAAVESLPDLTDEQDRLHALYQQVERRALMRYGTVQPGYLPALAAWAGPDRYRCTVVRIDGVIVGFSLVLKDGEVAIAHTVGFDYAANAKAPIYLRLLHSILEDGLALGCRTIHYGRTALEPKARLGATPVETEVWIRHSHPLINLAVGPLLRLAPQDRAPHREPFRR